MEDIDKRPLFILFSEYKLIRMGKHIKRKIYGFLLVAKERKWGMTAYVCEVCCGMIKIFFSYMGDCSKMYKYILKTTQIHNLNSGYYNI